MFSEDKLYSPCTSAMHYGSETVFSPCDATHDLSGLFWGFFTRKISAISNAVTSAGALRKVLSELHRSSAVSYREERERRESAVLLTGIMRSFLSDHTQCFQSSPDVKMKLCWREATVLFSL